MKRVSVFAMLAMALLLSYYVGQSEAEEGPIVQAAPEAAVSVAVTITGKNYCLLCALAKGDVVGATHPFAKLNALKVTEAKGADGKVLAQLAGKTLHYLPNKNAEALLSGDTHAGKDLTITGRLFLAESTLAVESFKVKGGPVEIEWDEGWGELPVGTLSTQQAL